MNTTFFFLINSMVNGDNIYKGENLRHDVLTTVNIFSIKRK